MSPRRGTTPSTGGSATQSPIHAQYTSQPSSAARPGPPASYGSYQQGSSSASNYVPQRTAPPPPNSYEYNDGSGDVRNGHAVGLDPNAPKRDSYGGGAAKSSYVPSSRPPYKSAVSTGGPTYQPSRPPPAPPLQTSGFGANGPSSPSSNPSTPVRRPSFGAGGSFGGPAGWEVMDDAPQAPPKRPAPPPVTSSLRDLSEALPITSSRSGYGASASANSSSSSLVNYPAAGNDMRLAQTQHGSNQQHNYHHGPTASTSQSYSLLTDPATSAAAGLAADVPSAGPAAAARNGGGATHQQGRPGSGGAYQYQPTDNRLADRSASGSTVDSPAGSSRSGEKEPKSKSSEKSGKSKGGLGSFLGMCCAG